MSSLLPRFWDVDRGRVLLDGIDVPVVPLVVNVFAQPLPTLQRCADLGRRLAEANEARQLHVRLEQAAQ